MTRIIPGCALVGLLGVLVGGPGCGPGSLSGGHPPTARIVIAPAYVPLGDAYHTEVTLDGTSSDDALDDPTRTETLGYLWSVEDDGAMLVPDERAPKVTIHVAGTRAVAVHLTVSDADDDRGTATAYVGITMP